MGTNRCLMCRQERGSHSFSTLSCSTKYPHISSILPSPGGLYVTALILTAAHICPAWLYSSVYVTRRFVPFYTSFHLKQMSAVVHLKSSEKERLGRHFCFKSQISG